jgi:predicted dehydrogenase
MSHSFTVAFVGCGKRARAHAVGVQADSRCRVVGLADLNPAAAEALNNDFKFEARLFSDHRAMLAELEPDIVIISLWTPLHLPVFRDCVAANVRAVLLEKPMAPTWGDCLEMASLAEMSGCQLTFCHQRRFAAGNRLVRKLIADGVVGKIERMELYGPPNLLDCGTHTIDQAMSFNDESPVKWVLGAIDASEPIKWFDVSSECMAVGTLMFANGVRATLQSGGPDKDLADGVRINGDAGMIEVTWDGVIKRAKRYNDPAWPTPASPEDHKDRHMIAYVKDAIDNLVAGTQPELSYQKALRVTESIFAFYESVRRHARVDLPLTGVTDNPFLTLLESGRFAGSRAVSR